MKTKYILFALFILTLIHWTTVSGATAFFPIDSQILFGRLGGVSTSSINLSFTTSSIVSKNILNVIGTVSSTEMRTPSSTIGTLFVTSCTGCGGFSNGVDSQVLFGILGGSASSSLTMTYSSSTGVFTSGSSSLAQVSSTNISATGYVSASKVVDTGIANSLVLSGSTGILGNYGGASGCALPGAVTAISAAGATTCVNFLQTQSPASSTGVLDSQMVIGLLGGFTTSTYNITYSSSTGALSVASGTITNASTTSLGVSTKLQATYATASKCARFDANQQIVSATGDCTAGDTTGGGGTGSNQYSVQLTPFNAVLPDIGFAYPTRTVTTTISFVSLNYQNGTSSDAFWGPFLIPPNLTFNTTTIYIAYTTTSTTAISGAAATSSIGLYWTANSTSSGLTMMNLDQWTNFKNVSSTYATSTALAVMGETVNLSSSTFSRPTGTLPSYVNFRINRPATDKMNADLEFLWATISFW